MDFRLQAMSFFDVDELLLDAQLALASRTGYVVFGEFDRAEHAASKLERKPFMGRLFVNCPVVQCNGSFNISKVEVSFLKNLC
jgi:hypothetical protein